MASTRHGTTRTSRSALGNGVELAIARTVALALLIFPAVALYYLFTSVLNAPPSTTGQQLTSVNIRTLFGSEDYKFLPSPVPALPAESNAGPPAPSNAESSPAQSQAVETVKVANTGGIGAVLRSEPPKGAPVASLRDGQPLQVLDRQVVGADEWIRVRTQSGIEGWIFGRLVGPAQ